MNVFFDVATPELALTSLNILAAPFKQELGLLSAVLYPSGSSLPLPSAAIVSVPVASTTTSGSEKNISADARPSVPYDDTPGDDLPADSGSAHKTSVIDAAPSTPQISEAQGAIPAPVTAFNGTASKTPAPPTQPLLHPAWNNSWQSVMSETSGEGDEYAS